MKVNRILIYSLLLAGITITSCKDDNPSIDDYWLNYEIEEVKVSISLTTTFGTRS